MHSNRETCAVTSRPHHNYYFARLNIKMCPRQDQTAFNRPTMNRFHSVLGFQGVFVCFHLVWTQLHAFGNVCDVDICLKHAQLGSPTMASADRT
eukprot:6320132-Amphidinium_carterae.1